jgi:hypothetical protein
MLKDHMTVSMCEVEWWYDSVSVWQVEGSYYSLSMSGWKIIRLYLSAGWRITGHYLHVRLKGHRLYLYVSWRIIRLCVYIYQFEWSYDSVRQVERSYECICMLGWRITRLCICMSVAGSYDCIWYMSGWIIIRLCIYMSDWMFIRLYLYVSLKGRTTLYLYVSCRIIRLYMVYVRLNVHTTVSICQVEGLCDSVYVSSWGNVTKEAENSRSFVCTTLKAVRMDRVIGNRDTHELLCIQVA